MAVLTNKEAIALLRTRVKPYNQLSPPMNQSKFSITIRNIEADLAKPKTAQIFLGLFGFRGTYNAWEIDTETWELPAK